jgi:hypothetical protein
MSVDRSAGRLVRGSACRVAPRIRRAVDAELEHLEGGEQSAPHGLRIYQSRLDLMLGSFWKEGMRRPLSPASPSKSGTYSEELVPKFEI